MLNNIVSTISLGLLIICGSVMAHEPNRQNRDAGHYHGQSYNSPSHWQRQSRVYDRPRVYFKRTRAPLYTQVTINSIFLGFSNSSTPQDRDLELASHVGYFSRMLSSARSFAELCGEAGKQCVGVVDWQGRIQPCDENGRDGSRIAHCM